MIFLIIWIIAVVVILCFISICKERPVKMLKRKLRFREFINKIVASSVDKSNKENHLIALMKYSKGGKRK